MFEYLRKYSSNSIGTPACVKTSLKLFIMSGPTPSPGTSVATCFPTGLATGLALKIIGREN